MTKDRPFKESFDTTEEVHEWLKLQEKKQDHSRSKVIHKFLKKLMDADKLKGE